MILKARLIKENEHDYFNNFIASIPKGHILQSYEWGEIKAKTGWQPLRLIIEKNDKPIAAISILKRIIPGLKKAIFYAPRGPVFKIDDTEVFDFMLKEVEKLAKEHKAIFFKVDPDISAENTEFANLLTSRGFRSAEKGEGFDGIQPKFVFRLDLTPDEETLMKNMHSKTRYNIRLAGKRGVTIKEDCKKEDLKYFYEILLETCERDNFLVRSYQYFEDMWDYLVENGYGKLFMAEYEGKYISGTLALIMGNKVWYLYGASSNQYRNVMPNYLLQWTMIKWAKENNCTLYDFRGVPGYLSEDNPLYGLFKFKKGFNGDYTEFIGEYDLVYSKFYYWLWHTVEPVYQKLIRKLINFKKKTKK
ncbi:Lipid II:glycine glycyltransferase (Peptidoglycan interpeptide bridge formation enzyme) [Desulfonispora thiosulfatigenes DSM 11270]|uniref:Lipid II:glycine glycyltransferase (Peptidoglycan interpeptide bridge formation enzyme) n=1 Tax=Desulfonispora thiosulfatigenes DSM 11270 TaxID=656914 RepID=A0A1W1UZ54_DESTI|nr:peptidoglycan bridge formation glycyltransferase FemA/FemB family protein [Desulfonispora thiosulfatigenes]SMB86346.1 Lipid II:glycine glycyltransferase (Peptidoglycan interpeptide bridge formation enzyme) [Desulfonispora thiosulfatigenes DSM 11270]